MPAAAVTEAWRWQPHPEVWLLVVGVIALGFYVTRVIGPKVVEGDEPITTTRQKVFFWSGVVTLWFASDWPMHDLSEEYLYALHMVQHLLFTFVIPPLFLLATPVWLGRLMLGGDGPVARWVRRFSRPVVAGVVFNAVIALTHWPAIVNLSIESGGFHYLVHLVVVTTAFLMWMPVCGPMPEWRMSIPGQMLYLFLMSIIPTVPAAWLTFAENPVYSAYDHPGRLWDVSVAQDQQAAGLIMKLAGGFYLWTIITTLFFRWAFRHEQADRQGREVSERELLTWEEVRDEFDRLGPPPLEQQSR